METISFEDVTLEISRDDKYGYVHLMETVDSAINRVAKVFGFDKKRITPLIDNQIDVNEDARYVWRTQDCIYTEGYFKVGKITYHFHFDMWDNFKPSLFSEL